MGCSTPPPPSSYCTVHTVAAPGCRFSEAWCTPPTPRQLATIVIACQVWWCFVVGGPGVPDPVHGPADPAGHLHQPSPSGEAHRGVCQEQRYAGKYSICSCPTFISTINLMRIRLRYLALRTYQCFGSGSARILIKISHRDPHQA